MLVTVNLGLYTFSNVPLFYVIAASLLVGLIVSYVDYLPQAISTFFTIRNKNTEIKGKKDDVLELTKRIHQLELENEKLKHGKVVQPDDPNAL